jgi:hypothetical protein
MFPVDLAATLPVDALFLASGLSVAGVPVVLALRVTRLLRIARLAVIFRRWERLRWTNTGMLRLVKLFVGVLLIVHWIACGWFFVAVLEGFPGDSWVVLAGIHELGVGSQYLRSLYWGFVTTTTVGYGDITPNRDLEYAFTIVVMMVGASWYALIIGSIASLVSSIDSAKSRFWDRVDVVGQHLRSRDVPGGLQRQIQDYYEYIWDRYRGVGAEDLLSDLPAEMRLEVVYHLTRDLIEEVPLFRHGGEALRNALLMALESRVYIPDSFVVREGEMADGMYFVSSGRLSILSGGGDEEVAELLPGDYFGDLSLLLGERRTASVQASTHCDLFFLPASDFVRLKSEYDEFKSVLKAVSSEKSEKLAALVLDGCVL